MDLERLLSKITLIGTLALSSLYCGSNDAGTPCKSDVDCKGENRICERGECVDYTPPGQTKIPSCEQVCTEYGKCDSDWGAYDSKENCIKDCVNEPWSDKEKYCSYTSFKAGCDSKSYQSCKKNFN